MRKLNGIIKGFHKVIAKLDRLVQDNTLLADVLSTEVVEKNRQIKDLDYESAKAKSVCAKITELVS